MKRSGVLHAQLSRVVAETGHTDLIVVADAGLPVPPGVERVDLAVVPGVPSASQVLRALVADLCVEGVTLAEEINAANPAARDEFLTALGLEPKRIRFVPHEAFKALTRGARAVVRTGECRPYAHVTLHAGVPF